MLTFVSGEDLVLAVPFRRGGEPFVPDVGSVTWTLRNTSGDQVIGYVGSQITTDTSTTEIQVPVPAAQNAITGGRRFEKRAVIVRGTAGGEPFERRVLYRITPYLNHAVTEDDVRSYMGMDAGEVPDAMIDITAAYFSIEDKVATVATLTALETALASGTIQEQSANLAITARAVLDMMPSLRQKLMLSETDGQMTLERDKLDLDALAGRAASDLALGMAAITGIAETTVPIFSVVQTITDPVTGA